ncbi:hypothetical protein TKK_0013694 [Trichogramma kaykai]
MHRLCSAGNARDTVPYVTPNLSTSASQPSALTYVAMGSTKSAVLRSHVSPSNDEVGQRRRSVQNRWMSLAQRQHGMLEPPANAKDALRTQEWVE